MELKPRSLLFLQFAIMFNVHNSLQNPDRFIADQKAAYKSGELEESAVPITLDTIKAKLKATDIFDYTDPTITDTERKELSKLFDAVEIMTTSRARQPLNVQNIFLSLRLVERAIKKQMKEGQISESLAGRFNWEKLKYPSRKNETVKYTTHNIKNFVISA